MNGEYKIKGWVARDFHGRISLFKDRPIRKDGNWESCLEFYHLLRSDFPEITWSNNPIEVEITINKI